MQISDPATSTLQGTPVMGNRIRARRRKVDLTLQALAKAAGVSTGYLSLIERNKAVPTLTTLDKIARALDVGLEEFVTRPQPVDCMTRATTRPRFHVGSELLGYERVSAQFPGSELSSYVLTVAPGYQSEQVVHAGEEHIYVLCGALEFRLEDERLMLSTGDSVHYASERSHGWGNPFQAVAQVLWTGTHDIFAPRHPVERNL